MYAALMILHLLFSFKSLLAFYCRTFEFVLVMNIYIVLVELFSGGEGRISNFASLNEPFYPTFVPKVRATQFKGPTAR